MCTILLPIKPEYVDKIVDKTKRYEYRKNRGKREIDKIIIYSTTPVKKVIGEVVVQDIIKDNPTGLWDKTQKYAGISKAKYNQYFADKKIAYAYKLGKVLVYDKPKELEELGINYYPQSHVYLE